MRRPALILVLAFVLVLPLDGRAQNEPQWSVEAGAGVIINGSPRSPFPTATLRVQRLHSYQGGIFAQIWFARRSERQEYDEPPSEVAEQFIGAAIGVTSVLVDHNATGLAGLEVSTGFSVGWWRQVVSRPEEIILRLGNPDFPAILVPLSVRGFLEITPRVLLHADGTYLIGFRAVESDYESALWSPGPMFLAGITVIL